MALWRYLEGGGTRASEIWHRRSGKDDVCLHWAAVAAHQRVATYWHMLPEFSQGRKAIWTAVNPNTGKRRIDEAFPEILRANTNDNEMFIRFKSGSTWQVVGSDRFDAAVGSPPAGITFSEWALSNPAAWAYLAPILVENRGWAIFITTSRGRNHAKTMHDMAKVNPGWHAQILTVDDTGFPKHLVEAQRQEYHAIFGDEAGDALIEQEYYCIIPGMKVWTVQGQVAVEEIKLNDVVLTHAGRWRKVVKRYEHEYVGEIIEIGSAGSGRPLVCTANHPIRICSPTDQTYRWIPAGDAVVGDYVVLPRLKLGATPIISAQLAELIAWFIAEGSVAKTLVQFSLNKTETKYAERIANVVAEFKKVTTAVRSTTLVVTINSAWLADFLTTNCGAGAANKRIPWSLIGGHEETVYKTLIDGDGCRGEYSGVQEVFTTISYSLALDVQMLAHMLGKRATVSLRPAEKQSSTIEGRLVKVSDAYSVRVAEIKFSRNGKPKVLPQKHGVAALIKTVSRRAYSGVVHNLGVQYDESYVAEGRVVHNCSFEAAVLGSYWGKELTRAEREGRIGNVEINPDLAVHKAWDIGVDDPMAIWAFQVGPGSLNVVDYYEASGHGFDHYWDWTNDKGYHGIDWVPHDAKVREVGAPGARTRIETMLRLGFKPKLQPEAKLIDGINAGRITIPHARFDAKRCAKGLDCLREYKAEWDSQTRVFKKSPAHDWACVTGDTEVLTRHGTCQIKNLPDTGEVLTPCGWKAYRQPRITRRNAPLVEVAFADGLTVKCTAEHRFLTVNGWKYAARLKKDSLIQSSLTPSFNISMANFIDAIRAKDILHAAEDICISMFGLMYLVQFQRVATSTIKTSGSNTTESKIWNAFLNPSIFRLRGVAEWRRVESIVSTKRLGMEPPNGINHKLGACGIDAKPSVPSLGKNGNETIFLAKSVAKYFLALFGRMVGHKSIVPRFARPLLIENVKPLNETSDVWCLTVDDGHWWSLANGAVTHNSHGADAWRGLSLSWREPIPAEEVQPMRGASEMTMDEAWELAQPRGRKPDARI